MPGGIKFSYKDRSGRGICVGDILSGQKGRLVGVIEESGEGYTIRFVKSLIIDTMKTQSYWRPSDKPRQTRDSSYRSHQAEKVI